jgi:tRNA dimethylallyltransferase
MGPTASGKTAAALLIAQRFPVEIISVDSAQVYRGMDIGTAKPDARTLREAPHHLIDILDPTKRSSAGDFCERALGLMTRITAAGRVPLLVGGTMLYFKALQDGLSDLPEADPAIRLVLETRAREVGWPALHDELAGLDPDTAGRLDPHDAQRIQRALEVIHATGRPLSQLIRERKPDGLPYRVIAASLEPSDRGALHERITQRFETMLELGLIGELRGLRGRFDLDADLPSMRCVGYRQTWDYVDGRLSFAQLRERGVAATRQLAKRQLTWLRPMRNVARFDSLCTDAGAKVLDHFRYALEARHNSGLRD